MDRKYYKPFNNKKCQTGLHVLTIAQTFPSLIQPWLVSQLVQIQKHGGDNKIISRSSQEIHSDMIKKHALDEKFYCVKSDKASLFRLFSSIFSHPSRLKVLFKLFQVYMKDPGRLGMKKTFFDILVSPAFYLRPDVVHSHSEMAAEKFQNLIKATGAPHVITFHGLPPVGVRKLTVEERQRYTKDVELVFVNTEFAKQHYIALGGAEDKIIVVPQGIELANWPFSTRPYPKHTKLQLLTVGRYHPDKGHKFAIDAVHMLLTKGFDIHYTLVGNGPEHENLKAYCKEIGLEKHVTLLTKVPDSELKKIYARSHIFILPSLRSKDGFHEETQGVVLQEAQASGLITIATRSGGIPECIDDNVSGFLVPDRDAAAIATMVVHLIDRQEEWPEIQSKARDWVKTRYCADMIGKKMNYYYHRAIKSSQKKTSELTEGVEHPL